MPLSLSILAFSAALAGILGFAAHRANICTVKAVEEILTTRRAYMLLSFGKTVLWVILVTLVLSWTVSPALVVNWKVSYFSLFGGLLFGVGAALNEGCAFALLAKLATGKLTQVFALAGLVAGAAGFLLFAPDVAMPVAELPGDNFFQQKTWSGAITAALLIWAVWEVTQMWRTRTGSTSLLKKVFSQHYSLAMASILIGVSNGVLYTIVGTWAYTGVLNNGVRQFLGGFGPIGPVYWVLFASLFLGMAFSAWQSRSIVLEWAPALRCMRQFLAGLLMGLGIAMVPGGNDVLILNGIPSLSTHALPAYLAMIVGIAATLVIIRRFGGTIETVDCSSGVCLVRNELQKTSQEK